MPAMDVSASIGIEASLDAVRAVLSDFRTWPAWSPWLYVEPGATVTYRGEPGELGHGYAWAGEKVGIGRMSLTALGADRLVYELAFVKPFKSTAVVSFELVSLDETRTSLTWRMSSRLPFFMAPLAQRFRTSIARDYERGLLLLKDQVELGEAPSSTTRVEAIELPAQPFVALPPVLTRLEALGETLASGFGELLPLVADHGIARSGHPFAIYREMDVNAGVCDLVVAVPITGARGSMEAATERLRFSDRPGGRALRTVHTGPYRHLPNAWRVLESELRQRKVKAARNAPPFESYVSGPETPEEAFVTQVVMPLRG